MDTNRIRELLAKYYDGSTSLGEEKTLREYFAGGNDIPADMVSSAMPLILCKASADDRPDPGHLEARISAAIDNEASLVKPEYQRRLLYRIIAAASFALLIGAGILIYRLQKGPGDTFKDPVVAYNEARKTLLYVSEKLNQGMEPLSHVAAINTGTDKLQSLEKMDESLGMLELVSFINKSSNLKK